MNPKEKKIMTTIEAANTVLKYHFNPNYGNIPDNEIDKATLFLAKYVKELEKALPKVLQRTKFDKVKKENKQIYIAWTQRILETVDMMCEDKGNGF